MEKEMLAELIIHTCPTMSAWHMKKIQEYSARKGILISDFTSKIYMHAGITEKQTNALIAYRKSFSLSVLEEELMKYNVTIVPMTHAEYPTLLKEIYDPPAFLFTQGKIQRNITYIAVVGTRKPTSYGISCTRAMVTALVRAGFGIVSGLAQGIDSTAHHAAIDAGGHTIAVIAHGHARYASHEYALAKRIVEREGAIISEYIPSVEATPYRFPIRNRLIAGIARATLITEATRKSGTMITASCAIRENRDVLAIPGLITNPNTEGPHALIADGAICIYSISRLLQAVGIQIPEESQIQSTQSLSSHAQFILQELQKQSLHLDELLEISHLSLGQLMTTLRELETCTLIEELPGQYFAVKPK